MILYHLFEWASDEWLIFRIEKAVKIIYNNYMVVLYVTHGCISCRRMKKWLEERNICYIEKNVFNVILNDSEIKYLLSRCENGVDDLISRRSKIIKSLDIDLDSMTIDELCCFIARHPAALKRPIIISERNMQVGYDEEEIDAFAIQELRKVGECDIECPYYKVCGFLREDK